jgi:hypothetical protein
MRAKTALWALPLAVFVAGGWSGNCFSQSDLGPAPSVALVPAAAKNSGQLVVAAVLPNSADELDSQVDASGAGGGENASREESDPAPKIERRRSTSKVGIGIKFSTLGAGIEAATPLTEKLNLRGGFNIFRYSRGITNNGIQYTGDLHFQSAEAHIDWFPLGGFHISPGLLFYNGNALTATAAVPGGKTFTLGGTTYLSDTAAPVTGTGKLDFVKVAPSIMLGFGNLIPRNGRHYSFLFEIGGVYQGSARVALNFSGNVCDPLVPAFCRSIASDPTVQANILAQQQKIKNDVNPYRFYPVVSCGIGFNF